MKNMATSERTPQHQPFEYDLTPETLGRRRRLLSVMEGISSALVLAGMLVLVVWISGMVWKPWW